jgi:hypothetical protein
VADGCCRKDKAFNIRCRFRGSFFDNSAVQNVASRQPRKKGPVSASGCGTFRRAGRVPPSGGISSHGAHPFLLKSSPARALNVCVIDAARRSQSTCTEAHSSLQPPPCASPCNVLSTFRIGLSEIPEECTIPFRKTGKYLHHQKNRQVESRKAELSRPFAIRLKRALSNELYQASSEIETRTRAT